MKVCVAEKPSVAKEIANILGANTRHDGYFEGNGYAVTWTFGHFCTLYTPEDYKPYWKRWDLNNLPMLPERFETKVMDNQGVQKQFGIIKKLFSKASEVINCGDAGQEGELIQRWVIKEAGYKGEVKRLWISSLTNEAIKNGFKNLKKASDFDNLYYAGSSRAIGDWLLGMNATRLYTLKFGKNKQVLSVGRVQTPTLAMIVDRHWEIENFKPQVYWELQTEYRKTIFNCEKGRFTNQEDGKKIFDLVKDKQIEIVSVVKKKGREAPPRLFDLTSLQVYCNTKFGYSADQTLKLAQGLYEKKVLSYPRVDTSFLPNDMYPKSAEILSKLLKYEKFTKPLLGKKLKKSAKVFNDKKVTDHHAIIPTGVEAYLNDIEQRVYDIVTRRYIGVFYDDCIVSNTNVQAKVDTIKFKTSGKEIVEENWRVLFPRSSKSEASGEKTLPTFKEGEMGDHKPSFAQKETKPPNKHTEATLLRAMETAGKKVDDEELREIMKENGIGRPSTRANIIETLFRREYIVRNKKQIVPTDVGIQLIGVIKNKSLTSASLTGQWEKKLKEIENGEYNAASFIKNMKLMVANIIDEVRMQKAEFNLPSTTEVIETKAKPKKTNKLLDTTCPKCKQGKLIKGKVAYGCSSWRQGCNFVMPEMFLAKKISDSQLIKLVTKNKTSVLKGFKRGDAKLNGYLEFDSSFALVLVEDKNYELCPKCKKGTIIKGKTAYGCSHWKAGCSFKVPFDIIREKAKGKTMTKDLVYGIFESEG